MENYNNLLERYQKQYTESFHNSIPLLIDAFTIYYGEKYHDYIEQTIKNTCYCYFSTKKVKFFYDKVIRIYISRISIHYIQQILQSLGFNVEGLSTYLINPGTLYEEEGKLKIDFGKIQTMKNNNGEIFDPILNYLYGSSQLFSFDYEQDKIYQFFSLSKEEQNEVVKAIWKEEQVTEKHLFYIQEAINFMKNHQINKEDQIKLYQDFYIVAQHFMQQKKKQKKAELLGSIDHKLENLNHVELIKELQSVIDEYPVNCSLPSFNERDSILNIVAIPLMISRDIDVIHEINHAVSSSILLITDDDFIEKKGIHIGDDTEKDFETNTKNLEELLNYKSSLEIETIFHNLGGKIIPNNDTIEGIIENSSVCAMEYYFPLIDSFYERYKELLKTVRITDQLDLLYSKIIKEKFIEYNAYINSIMQQTDSKPVLFSEEPIQKVNQMIDALESKKIYSKRKRTN